MINISRESEINLINLLIDQDIISGKDLANIKKVSTEGQTSQLDAVFQLKLTDEESILDLLVKEQSLEVVDLSSHPVPEDVKLVLPSNYITTNFTNTINQSKKYIKLLDQAIYHKSIISCRVVNNNKNDTRKSEIIKHTNNFYSIFGAKIITCIGSANNIYRKIKKL